MWLEGEMVNNTMCNKKTLEKYTTTFFDMHWRFDIEKPNWDFSWNWCGAVPNYLLGGVYALFRDDELLYIGLGNSRGRGIYEDRGISRRLMAHVFRNAHKDMSVSYVPRKRWSDKGVNLVATLGFPKDTNYLSPALEDYLIGFLNPPENSVKTNK